MAALVTLAVAKAHLRIPTADTQNDAEVTAKIDLASAVILDYLANRANKRATITSSSVASPTVVTTSAAHGFVTGETVVIAGHVNSAPDLNGSYTATVVTATTFTVPVAITTAGTGGTAIVEWSASTVPSKVVTAVLLMLTHLYEHRGDNQEPDDLLWQAVARILARSRVPAVA